MTWDELDRLNALKNEIDKGNKLSAAEIQEALAILIQDAINRAYGFY